eukprot:264682_1
MFFSFSLATNMYSVIISIILLLISDLGRCLNNTLNTTNAQISREELNVLIDFYESLDGDNWNCVGAWNVSEWKKGPQHFECRNWCGLGISQFECNVKKMMFQGFVIKGLNGTLPSLRNLTHLESLILTQQPMLRGSVPTDSFELMSKLHTLGFVNNHKSLTWDLDQTNLCETNLRDLQLTKLRLNGDFNTSFSCLNFKQMFIFEIIEPGNGLYGNIPDEVCGFGTESILSVEATFAIQNVENERFKSTIPDCVGDMNAMQIQFANIRHLYGTIPESLCNVANLEYLYLSNSKLSGTIPQCIFNTSRLPYLTDLELNGNHLRGTIPNLEYNRFYNNLLLDNNNLKGSISDIFGQIIKNNKTRHLWKQVTLNNNKFHDQNVTDVLSYFLQSESLVLFALSDNADISGVIPSINHTNTRLRQLILHNMDLHGTIPNNLIFTHLWDLTLFNNRLSGQIADHFVSPLYFNEKPYYLLNSSVVLPSNLFTTNSDDTFTKWIKLKSIFYTNPNLYITDYDSLELTIVFVFCMIVIAIFGCLCAKAKVCAIKHKYIDKPSLQTEADRIISNGFIEGISSLYHVFEDYRLILCVLTVLVICPFYATYFEAIPLLTKFTLSYYYTGNQNNVMNVVLLILCISHHIICSNIIYKLCIKQAVQPECNVQINNEPLVVDVESSEENKHDDEMDQIATIDQAQKYEDYSCATKTCHWFKLVMCFGLFLFGLFITFLYFIFESLPNHNIFKLESSFLRDFSTYCISFVLVINTTIIIPKLTDLLSYNVTCLAINNNKIVLINILRTIISIILPIIASFIFLNDCGGAWSLCWNECIDDPNSFTIVYENTNPVTGLVWDNMVLLKHDDICSVKSANHINWDKCYRSFIYHWSQVIITKLCILVFMPILYILKVFLMRFILSTNCYDKLDHENNCFWKYFLNDNSIKIKHEYCMILNLFELVIAYSFQSPFILPIALFVIKVNQVFYKFMYYRLKWRFLTRHTYQFPVYLLVIGHIIGQGTNATFFIFCIANIYISCCIIIIFMAINIAFVACYYQQKKKKRIVSS